MNYKCPVCGGDLVSGFYIRVPKTGMYTFACSPELVPLKRKMIEIHYPVADVRARVCPSCGHIDLCVKPSDLSDIADYIEKNN